MRERHLKGVAPSVRCEAKMRSLMVHMMFPVRQKALSTGEKTCGSKPGWVNILRAGKYIAIKLTHIGNTEREKLSQRLSENLYGPRNEISAFKVRTFNG